MKIQPTEDRAFEAAAKMYYETINQGRIGPDGLPQWEELRDPERKAKVRAMREAILTYQGVRLTAAPKRFVAPTTYELPYNVAQSGKVEVDLGDSESEDRRHPV